MFGDRSVLLVTSTDPKNSNFGSAFFVGRDAQGHSYVVTCQHVVDAVGGVGAVQVGGSSARFVPSDPLRAIDIAVLKADVPVDAAPLILGPARSDEGECTVIGYRKLYGDVREARRLEGSFDASILDFNRSMVPGWHLRMNEAVPDGYSGSPVSDRTTGTVIGVASIGFVGSEAVAVAVAEILNRWPEQVMLEPSRLKLRHVEFVYVPAGGFDMGTYEARARDLAEQYNRPEFADETPRTRLYLDAFYIARYPVTNAQFQDFVNETGAPVPYRRTDPWSSVYSWDPVSHRFPDGLEHHPVTLVSWSQARRYCEWLGASLPTEAEWEKAARGEDGRTWPWGNEWESNRCNSCEVDRGGLTPVDAFSPQGDSPFGAVDMSGNVWEWCSSLRDPYPYRADDGREDQAAEGERILRGGAFEQSRLMARCAARNAAHQDEFGFTIGFRPTLSARAR